MAQGPNAFFHTTVEHRAWAILKALRPLQPGEEILISYLDGPTLLEPTAVRQRILHERFGFRCTCCRCEE